MSTPSHEEKTPTLLLAFASLIAQEVTSIFGGGHTREVLAHLFPRGEVALDAHGNLVSPVGTVGVFQSGGLALRSFIRELSRTFGDEVTDSRLARAYAVLSREYGEVVLSETVLPEVPQKFLEEYRLKHLSFEDLQRMVREKTKRLQKINDELEEKVRVRTERLQTLVQEQDASGKLLIRRDLQLTRANEKLRALDETKSNFISVAAHQLRTPLSGIKWTLNLLLRGDLGGLSDEQKVFLAKAYESNDRMIALVNDMLNADRVESGKLHYRTQPLDMLNLLDNVLFEILPAANKKKIEIRFKNRSLPLPQVLADSERLRAVFQNLLENAIKYTIEGGMVEIGFLPKTDELEISISDNGIGIPAAEQKNVFNRFFRAKNAVAMETDGSGLGLFIVKSVLERQGGRIWFESEENKGTVFYVTVPTVQ